MRHGAHGEPVRDLQRRLTLAGFGRAGVHAGEYCPATAEAVSHFQSSRGLPADGVCDAATWKALVEACWRLGDRLLVLRSPNMRGDDVGELQTMLQRIGFDCGRVDGIFGPDTAGALTAFQRNCGLPADGVCGRDSITALEVLARQSGSGPGVAVMREIAALTGADRELADLRVVIGQFGGMSALVRQLAHALRHHGATVVPTDEPDPSAQAAAANRVGATVYVGLVPVVDDQCSVAYYSVPTFASPGGRALAHRLETALTAIGCPTDAAGLRHPVLRETRMTAVLCTLGPIGTILDRAPEVTAAIERALSQWIHDPLGDAADPGADHPQVPEDS